MSKAYIYKLALGSFSFSTNLNQPNYKMVLLKSLTYIAASVFLLNVASVNAAPMNEAQPLTKRGSKLHGKFLHITGKKS